MKKIDTSDNKFFNPSYNGAQTNQIFKTTFYQIDNIIKNTQVDISNNKIFNSNYTQLNKTFKTDFNQKDMNGDIQIDQIIIFDGGDVYGYETDNTNNI